MNARKITCLLVLHPPKGNVPAVCCIHDCLRVRSGLSRDATGPLTDDRFAEVLFRLQRLGLLSKLFCCRARLIPGRRKSPLL